MSIRDLRTFLAIAESGSFAAASRAVHRTQSAVTMQIKALEDQIGAPLFDRSKRPPVLNDLARTLIPKATEVVLAYDRLFQTVAGGTVEGHIRLGAVPSVMTGIMPKALVALRAKYPRLHVELAMGLSADLVERVRRGTVDAAIVSELQGRDTELRWSPFAREPLVLLAPMDAQDLSIEDLCSTYPFIRYTRHAWVGQLIDRYIRKRRLPINETMTLDTLEAITTMVHHGLGISIVPLRGIGEAYVLPVQRVALPGPAVFRVLGLVDALEHPKRALTDALLTELKALSIAAGTTSRGGASKRRRPGSKATGRLRAPRLKK